MQLLLITLAYRKSKIIFTGQTVGPVFSKKSERVLKALYKQADFISVRDSESHELLSSWGIDNKLIGDDAFLDTEFKLKIRNKNVGNKKRVVIVPKSFPGYEKHMDNFYRIMFSTLKEQDIKSIHIIPFRSNHNDLEYRMCEKIKTSLSLNGMNAQIVMCKTISDLEDELVSCDFLLGSAYHAVTLGLKYGCNVLALYAGKYYETKMKGILRHYDYEGTNCINMALEKVDAVPKVYDPQEILQKSSKLNSSVCDEWNKVIGMI